VSTPLAIVTVTNDLTTDQRVHRTCITLEKAGYKVLLTGRRLRHSLTLAPRSYETNRLRLIFDKGPLFYAEYNIRLFFFLISTPFSLVVSNDLDTLPACYLAYRSRSFFQRFRSIGENPANLKTGTRHLHDCHEYFRGVPELVHRKFVTRIWKLAEDLIFPKLNMVMAVNESVARLYHSEYGNTIHVVRNVPLRRTFHKNESPSPISLKQGQKMVIYQGAVNIGRGIEEAIIAMKHVTTDTLLVIAGTGDIFEEVKELAMKEAVSDKVLFTGQIPFANLADYTRLASIGLSIEKDISINYHYCLPNKFMDYIQSHVPVLVSPFPEMEQIVRRYEIGEFLISHDPHILAGQIDAMLNNSDLLQKYKSNLVRAAAELCWENEEQKLLQLVQ
jgi:glycosyltransferase involved in cell wall biosynthesis